MRLLVLFFILSNFVFSQDQIEKDSNNNQEISDGIVDVQPIYPGGMSACQQYIVKNLKLDQADLPNSKVLLKIFIAANGKVQKAGVLKGIPECPKCDEEFVRIIEKMPKWTPAQKDGRNVACWVVLPITICYR